MQEATPPLSERLRVPLYLKLMASYLIVVGLVFVPTLLYPRTLLVGSLRDAATARLDTELAHVTGRLRDVPTERLAEVVGFASGAIPHRITIVDLGGRVLADSMEGLRFGSHADRPEIKEALATGRGFAIRTSTTTHDERIYVAGRFPSEGPPRGVVRLSMPTASAISCASTSGTCWCGWTTPRTRFATSTRSATPSPRPRCRGSIT